MNKFTIGVTAAIAGAITAFTVQTHADQSERVVPTAGIYTGPQYAALIGDMARSISTANKGASAPANVGGAAVDGLEWLDDSSSPWIMKRRVGSSWVNEGAYDAANEIYVGVIGGGMAMVGSASTVDLGAAVPANVIISGSTTINSFGSSAPVGIVKIIRFSGALNLA